MAILQEVETLKTEYINLVNEYNKTGHNLQYQKYPEYTKEAQTNILNNGKKQLKEDTLRKVILLDGKVKNKVAEVRNRLLKYRYPLLTSTDTYQKNIGVIELGNAIRELSSLKDRNNVFALLDNAIWLGRKDYCSAIIDNLLAQKNSTIEINDTSIFVKPTTENSEIYENEQEFYNKLNDYRIGLNELDKVLAEINFANKEVMFLAESTTVLIKYLQSDEWVFHLFNGWELLNMEQTVKSLGTNSLESIQEMNTMIKYYGTSRSKSFLGLQ